MGRAVGPDESDDVVLENHPFGGLDRDGGFLYFDAGKQLDRHAEHARALVCLGHGYPCGVRIGHAVPRGEKTDPDGFRLAGRSRILSATTCEGQGK